MPRRTPSQAEKAMGANAESRAQQGVDSDKASKEATEHHGTANPPPSTDLMGPGGDPVERKRSGAARSGRRSGHGG
jgi:hypothetical protein